MPRVAEYAARDTQTSLSAQPVMSKCQGPVVAAAGPFFFTGKLFRDTSRDGL